MAVNTKHVIYLSYDGMTDPLGQSQVLPYLIGLSKQGYTFHLISCEKPNKFLENKSIITNICQEHGIHWHPISYHKSPPVISTIYDIYLLNKKAKEICKKHTIQFLHCRSYIAALVAVGIKKKQGIPFLFDMRGLWADERVDGGQWNLKNPLFNFIYKYFKKKEKQFITQSNAIISLTHAGKQELLSWNTGIPEQKITVIPCCADELLFNENNITEEQKNKLRLELGLQKTDTVLIYLGSIGTWYLTTEMLAFFKQAKEQISNAKLLIVTPDDKEIVKQHVLQAGISIHDVAITFAQRKEVPAYISISQFGLFFIKPSYSKISSSPTKKAEILFMNKPVICNTKVGDTASLVLKNNWGFVVDEFTTDTYNTIIEKLKLPITNTNIREQAINIFSLQKGINSYALVYNTAFNGA
jgi:glycosyltransferase involved in cell wall biosynthesis